MKILKQCTWAILFCFVSILSVQAQDEEDIYADYESDTDSYEYWDRFMSPGVGYSSFIPTASDSLGIFHGLSTEFVFSSNYSTYGGGPSHMRFYARISIQNSTQAEVSKLMHFTIGSNFSFEKAAKRKFLIPYFGLEMGGVNQKDIGGAFHLTPIAGMHLLTTKHVSWYVQGGYSYAFKHFDQLSGIYLTSGVTVSFW